AETEPDGTSRVLCARIASYPLPRRPMSTNFQDFTDTQIALRLWIFALQRAMTPNERALVRSAAARLAPTPDLAAGLETAPARTTDPGTAKTATGWSGTLTARNAQGKLAEQFWWRQMMAGEGLTADEAVDFAGLGHLSCPWKRVSDLKAHDLIE